MHDIHLQILKLRLWTATVLKRTGSVKFDFDISSK